MSIPPLFAIRSKKAQRPAKPEKEMQRAKRARPVPFDKFNLVLSDFTVRFFGIPETKKRWIIKVSGACT